MLLEVGVLSKNIIRSNEFYNLSDFDNFDIEKSLCTYCSNEFHSYRKKGKEAGRNGAFILV